MSTGSSSYIIENLSSIHILNGLFSNSRIKELDKSIIDSTLCIMLVSFFSFLSVSYKLIIFSNLDAVNVNKMK